MAVKHGNYKISGTKISDCKTRDGKKQVKCYISLYGKVKTSAIRSKSKVKDIFLKIKETKRWAGHPARRENNKWTKRRAECQPRTGKRKRGRQKRRWRDDITIYIGTTWARTAQERGRLQLLEEGFIRLSQWMV